MHLGDLIGCGGYYHLDALVIALCLGVLCVAAVLITLDLASDDIAGAFRDAFDALKDYFRP